MPLHDCPFCKKALPQHFYVDEVAQTQFEKKQLEARIAWQHWKNEKSKQWPLLRLFSNCRELSTFGAACTIGCFLAIFSVRYWWPVAWGDKAAAEGAAILVLAGFYILSSFSDWYIRSRLNTGFKETYPEYAPLV